MPFIFFPRHHYNSKLAQNRQGAAHEWLLSALGYQILVDTKYPMNTGWTHLHLQSLPTFVYKDPLWIEREAKPIIDFINQ